MKVYFHGRLWCARSSDSLPLLPDGVIGDDVYLPGWLTERYGFDAMRLDYRARVYFHPNDSLIRHWKVYRRIHEDRKLVYSIDAFKPYVDACPLKLDWTYIVKACPFQEVLYFILYAILVRIEKFTYRFSRYNVSYWQYNKREV